MVKIVNPVAGKVSGNNVPVSLSATDDSGAVGITQMLYIDGVLKAPVRQHARLQLEYPKSCGWNHNIQVVAKDAVGNKSSASVIVTVVK